jgi:hypothetical protein
MIINLMNCMRMNGTLHILRDIMINGFVNKEQDRGLEAHDTNK